MTKRREVAKTLMTILDHPLVQDLMDRQSNCLDLIDDVNSWWMPDLFSRKPSPAEFDDSGNLIKATNLDLATFLYSLADRKAVINLPVYTSRRPKSTTEGTIVTSSQNRHGQIIGLVSNKEVFSFGIRILDMNVISSGQVGFPRAYIITDFDGSFYSGWKSIQFIPDAKENQFLFEHKLLSENKILFDNFVTPEKWISFYGQYYFITKSLIQRLVEEQTHLKSEKERLIKAGVKIDENDSIQPEFPPTSKEPGKKIQVDAFEVEVDLPEYINSYLSYPTTVEDLKLVVDKISKIRKALEKFRFMARCVELAASKQKYMETFPSWIQNVSWETNYKASSRSRSFWNRLRIVQPGPFQKSIAIRTRWFKVTQQVREEAEVPVSASNAESVFA